MKLHTARYPVLAFVAGGVLLTVVFWGWERQGESSLDNRTSDAPESQPGPSDDRTGKAPRKLERTSEHAEAQATFNTPWGPAASADSQTPPKVRDDVPATLMAINRSMLESLNPGDVTQLPMGGDGAVAFTIDARKDYEAYGVTSLKGSVVANGTSLPVVITYGEDSTLATISTRAGTYELRGSESRAWLYRSRDLGLPGGSVVDYLVPDREIPTVKAAENSGANLMGSP